MNSTIGWDFLLQWLSARIAAKKNKKKRKSNTPETGEAESKTETGDVVEEMNVWLTITMGWCVNQLIV